MDYDSLKAFLVVHSECSFTRAAEKLGLSQSALSQKIARLEDYLMATVFIRKSSGPELTAAGEKLMIFARQQLQMQEQFLAGFHHSQEMLSGIFRLAGFSSITRSVLIPSLVDWLRKNPLVSLEFSSHEVIRLEQVLKNNQADAIVTDYFPQLPGIEHCLLGQEEYILIEAKNSKSIPDVYLDHGPHDNATDSYFKHQNYPKSYRRGFMGDVYGILDGVAAGLGRAVMSRHLVRNDPRFKIKRGKKIYLRPVVLSYYQQAYYPPIHRAAIEQLKSNCKIFLER